jgi:hypothetical protein
MDKAEIIDRIASNDTDVVKDVVLELIMNSYNNKTETPVASEPLDSVDTEGDK